MKVKNINKFEKILFLTNLLKNKYFRRLPKKLMIKIFKDFYKIKIKKIDNKYLVNFFIPPIPSKAFDRCLSSFINNRNSLLKCHISVTNDCTYNCKVCSNDYRKKGNLSIGKIKKIIEELQKKGVPEICFTGGEPLLRKDLHKIIECVGDKSVSYVYTTGFGLNKKRALELKNAGLFGIAISLDSHNSELNDYLKGFKGAFEKAINAIKVSKKVGLYTMVQTVVTKKTIDNLIDFLKFVNNLNVDEVILIEPIPCGRILDDESFILDSHEREKIIEVDKLSNERKDLPKVTSYGRIESEEFFGCVAGYNFLYIDARGEVCPCDFIPLSFGNLYNESFDIIWNRMKEVFPKPREYCFSLKVREGIIKKFKGRYPLNYEDSKGICKNYKPKTTSKYYLLLNPKN